MRVSVVIPTHNEARAIARVLADLPSDLTTEVLVVDSNSSDGTPDIAARMGARVVQEPRRGYGRACLTGLAAANSPDVVVFLDGDYSDRPAELPILLAPINEGRADITLGSRLRQRNLPLRPIQEPYAQLIFEFANLLADRRLRDVQPLRSPAEVQLLCDGNEISEVAKFHPVSWARDRRELVERARRELPSAGGMSYTPLADMRVATSRFLPPPDPHRSAVHAPLPQTVLDE